jgi:hypothetical protein
MAEEEAKAAMMPILRFDSINDEEKDIMRQKEQDLQRLLEEQKDLAQKQLEIIEKQKQELEYQKW